MYLDLRHLGEALIDERLPGIRDLCIHFAGVDPVVDPVPVQPGQHYSMGGVDTDVDGATQLEGLFAAGECACVSVHGANRLGGNSLLETLVFGRRAGLAAAGFIIDCGGSGGRSVVEAAVRDSEERIAELMGRETAERVGELRAAVTSLMDRSVQVFREEAKLTAAVEELRDLRRRCSSISVRCQSLPLQRGPDPGA